MDILFTDWMGKPLWMWAGFLSVVLVLLVLDLTVLHRKQHAISMRESLFTTLGYCALATLFGCWVWWELGATKGLEYFTGYVVEFSLAMDNVFVIAMILGYFQIPPKYQHRVLFWGILGVIVLRGIMIAAGAALIQEYAWVLYVFAGFLVISGIKMLMMAGHESNLGDNPLLKLLRKYGRVTDDMHGERFWVRLKDKNTGHYAWYMTPLFVALILVEVADVVFAVDSVPAIFAITTDPYIVYTSNIFAILGLRALYFTLSGLIERFAYLKYALAILLIFIGSKIFMADVLGLEKIPPSFSLTVTFGILITGVVYSLWKTRKAKPKATRKA
jgi:tellurite resistance protein TerC